MGQSFIRQGTSVICTNMTCAKPQKIGITRGERYVMNTAENEPLLNVDDRKISACFECKVPKSIWGGLVALCVGICIGVAVTAAIVATGGAAAVALAAVAAAKCAVIVTVAVAAVSCVAYAVNHDCDATLDSKWDRYHKKVFIEGKQALLNTSFMNCRKGGVVNIILDEVVAKEAAEYIAEQNDNAVSAQLGSQLVQGLISGVAGTLTGGLGLVDMAVSVGCYAWSAHASATGTLVINEGGAVAGSVYGEMRNGEIIPTTANVKSTAEAVNSANVAVDASTEAIQGYESTLNNTGRSASLPGRGQNVARIEQSRAQRQLNVERVRRSHLSDIADDAVNANNTAINANKSAWKKFGKSLGINMLVAAINSGIDAYSNDYEDSMAEKAQAKLKEVNDTEEADAQVNASFMGIVANNG